MRDPYEQNREDNAVGPDDDGRYDLGEIDVEDGLVPKRVLVELNRVLKAAEEQTGFFFDALKRNGVL